MAERSDRAPLSSEEMIRQAREDLSQQPATEPEIVPVFEDEPEPVDELVFEPSPEPERVSTFRTGRRPERPPTYAGPTESEYRARQRSSAMAVLGLVALIGVALAVFMSAANVSP